MREIKFRVYRFTSEEMVEWETLKNLRTLAGFLTEPTDDYYSEAMQYTGLKDRNDKEIYEGDILKCTDDADCFITNGVVEWLHDFWNISTIEDSLYQFTRYGYVEVIGNIYQNPEFLLNV